MKFLISPPPVARFELPLLSFSRCSFLSLVSKNLDRTVLAASQRLRFAAHFLSSSPEASRSENARRSRAGDNAQFQRGRNSCNHRRARDGSRIGLQPLVAKDVPRPVPESDQLLVCVGACAVCRTDLHVLDGELPNPKLPLILGHEIVGRVEPIGTQVRYLTRATGRRSVARLDLRRMYSA